MILPRLRADLDFSISPLPSQPGLLIRDSHRYSDFIMVSPPPLVSFLAFFDGEKVDLDLRAELTRSLNISESDAVADQLI
jgi:hypothetical protein